VSEAHVRRTDTADDQIRTMLDAFAGPASPRLSASGSRRRATRRTVILLVAGIVALGFAVPGALALFRYWETPKQFLSDSTQPAYAKRFVREWLTSRGYMVTGDGLELVALTRGVTASTPTGGIRVYALRLAHGEIGFAVFTGRNPRDPWVYIIPTSKAQTGPIERIWYRPCPDRWALQYLTGDTFQIGRTVAYALGRAANSVASVQVRYQDGSTTRGAVADGYFVAWMKPSAAWTNVTVIGENAAGTRIASLVVAGNGGMPFWSVKPSRPFACAP
jgi:hypothetical protein